MKKVALVTGSSSGIGMETAKLLVQHGYTVYGAARRVVATGGGAKPILFIRKILSDKMFDRFMLNLMK